MVILGGMGVSYERSTPVQGQSPLLGLVYVSFSLFVGLIEPLRLVPPCLLACSDCFGQLIEALLTGY